MNTAKALYETDFNLWLTETVNLLRKGDIEKLDLENLLEKPVDSFAYPHGDYTEVSVNLVQESGFHYACSTIPRSIQGNLDYFQLPRVEVQDWDRKEFTQWLLHLFHN